MKIYFSPDCPKLQDYSIVAMIHYLGYTVVKSAEEEFDFAFMWQDATRINPGPELLRIASHKPVLNMRCTDISKRKVDQIWKEVCGYGSLIDPTQYHGKALKKTDENGMGRGEVMDCPIPVDDLEADCVYQSYIETSAVGAQLEYRLPYILGSMPLVFEVLKDDPESVPGRRIRSQYKRSITPRPSSDIFTASEHEQITFFCQDLGLDMGELDILRCRHSKRLYIIDANTTPTYFNMFNRYWKTEDKRMAIHMLALCWEQQLLKILAT
ncbi:hypothetical protein [Undibacterium sp. TS12]|uniref:hypothetical protein n=1 Tax=Undibacterium sp. TS12 TaxID=2908202 RepID=UPI001F4CC7F2|nr:hypothetical protein [Undibacterium sp. TS12]MCH8622533.1 hypothetical protein [Undibacterium sp. TS12]